MDAEVIADPFAASNYLVPCDRNRADILGNALLIDRWARATLPVVRQTTAVFDKGRALATGAALANPTVDVFSDAAIVVDIRSSR